MELDRQIIPMAVISRNPTALVDFKQISPHQSSHGTRPSRPSNSQTPSTAMPMVRFFRLGATASVARWQRRHCLLARHRARL
jgi:hypothetical protein